MWMMTPDPCFNIDGSSLPVNSLSGEPLAAGVGSGLEEQAAVTAQGLAVSCQSERAPHHGLVARDHRLAQLRLEAVDRAERGQARAGEVDGLRGGRVGGARGVARAVL